MKRFCAMLLTVLILLGQLLPQWLSKQFSVRLSVHSGAVPKQFAEDREDISNI